MKFEPGYAAFRVLFHGVKWPMESRAFYSAAATSQMQIRRGQAKLDSGKTVELALGVNPEADLSTPFKIAIAGENPDAPLEAKVEEWTDQGEIHREHDLSLRWWLRISDESVRPFYPPPGFKAGLKSGHSKETRQRINEFAGQMEKYILEDLARAIRDKSPENKKTKVLIKRIATSLIRSYEGQREYWCYWQVISPELVSVLNKNQMPDEALIQETSQRILQVFERHLELGHRNKISFIAKYLIPPLFCEFLSSIYENVDDFSVSVANAWHFGVHNITKPEDGAQRALMGAIGLLRDFNVREFLNSREAKEQLAEQGIALTTDEIDTYGSTFKLTPADAWRFGVRCTKPEDVAKRAVLGAIGLLKTFDVKEFLDMEEAKEHLARQGITLSADEIEAYGSTFKLTPANAWYFGVNNLSKPEAGAKRAVMGAVGILKTFDVKEFLGTQKAKRQLEVQGISLTAEEIEAYGNTFKLTPADAWHFGIHKISKPVDSAKKAILGAIGLLKTFDVREFLGTEEAKEQLKTQGISLIAEEIEAYGNTFKLTPAFAWYFGVYYLSKPEDGAKRAVIGAIRILETFNVREFLNTQEAKEKLAKQRIILTDDEINTYGDTFKPSPAFAWYFGVYYISKPLDGAKRAVIGAIGILKNFDVKEFLDTEAKGRLAKQGITLTAKEIYTYGNAFKLTPADALRFGAYNISEPVDGAKRAVQGAIRLLKAFDVRKFLNTQEAKGKLAKQGITLTDDEKNTYGNAFKLTPADSWRFGVYYLSKPEDGAKRAVMGAIGLLKTFDAKEFLNTQEAKERLSEEGISLSSEEIDTYGNKFKLSTRNAWQFGVHNISKPEDGAKRAVVEMVVG